MWIPPLIVEYNYIFDKRVWICSVDTVKFVGAHTVECCVNTWYSIGYNIQTFLKIPLIIGH